MTISRRSLAALPLAAAAVSAFSFGARAQDSAPSVRPLHTPGEGAWSEVARARVVAEAEAAWPGWPVVVPVPALIAQNADAVARELGR